MTSSLKNTFTAMLCAGLLTMTASLAGASPLTFYVSVTTTPLIGDPSAPFFIDFQLSDGGGTATNTASIFGFAFGGGSAVPGASLFGTASGSLESGVSLTDSTTPSEFYQAFLPGSTLTFGVTLSSNLESGLTPDAFRFAILDSSLGFPAQIFTTEPGYALSLAAVDITSNSLALGDVRTYTSASPSPLGVTATATPVPEPGSLVLIAVGLVGFGARRFRRAHQ